MTRRLPPGSLGVCLVLLAGCADPYGGRVEVVGKVSFKGQPLSGAIVQFVPLEEQASGASAQVEGGAYAIDRPHGLQPGKYLVRLTKGDAKTPVNPVDPDHPPGPGGGANIISRELIPADWGVNSKQERTVTRDSPNTIDLTIP